jgi:hypothetical protein
MERKNKKHNIYKTINLVNGNFYWGVHDSIDENDGYFGSGEVLLKAVRKYGKENFRRVTKLLYDTAEEAFADERLIVNKKMISRNDCYNACEGGKGGNGGPVRKGMKNSDESKLKQSRTMSKKYSGKNNPFYGKQHKSESKTKMSESIKEKWKNLSYREQVINTLSNRNKGQNNPMSRTNRELRRQIKENKT